MSGFVEITGFVIGWTAIAGFVACWGIMFVNMLGLIQSQKPFEKFKQNPLSLFTESFSSPFQILDSEAFGEAGKGPRNWGSTGFYRLDSLFRNRLRGALDNAVSRPLNFFRSHTRAYQCHPPGLVAWRTPEWTIVSRGHNDRNPEVTTAFTSQGSAVLHTADHGAVTATIAAGEVSVRGFHAVE